MGVVYTGDLPGPDSLFGNISVSRAQLHIRLASKGLEDSYLGSALRGLIGWQLRRLVCLRNGKVRCKQCIARNQCPSYIIMEGKTPLPGLREAPRGYVLYPRRLGQGCASYIITLTLIGETMRFYPLVVRALVNGQRAGIGRKRITYELKGIGRGGGCPPETFLLAESVNNRPLRSGTIKVKFITPLRLRKSGRYIGEFDAKFLLESTARRLEALSLLYAGGKRLGRDMWLALSDLFSKAPEPAALGTTWKEYSRYSNRQHRKVPMGGVVGWACYENPPEWFIRWLRAASVIHVGKGTAMGLGRIEMEEET